MYFPQRHSPGGFLRCPSLTLSYPWPASCSAWGSLELTRCFPWSDLMTTWPQASSDKLARGPHTPLPSEGQGPGRDAVGSLAEEGTLGSVRACLSQPCSPRLYITEGAKTLDSCKKADNSACRGCVYAKATVVKAHKETPCNIL